MKKLSTSNLIILSAFLSACAADVSPTKVLRDGQAESFTTTASIAWDPAPNSVEVPPEKVLRIKFSSPVDPSSIKDLSIRVENHLFDEDASIRYETEEKWNSAYDEVEIRRKYAGRELSWDLGTSHFVKIELLNDLQGKRVSPFRYKFTTAKRTQGKGNFKILEVGPPTAWIKTTNYIYFVFNKPIYGIEGCSTDTFAGAIQVRVISSKTQVGQTGIPSLGNAEICLRCGEEGCNILTLRPLEGWPRPSLLYPQFIWVSILDSWDLRSTSHETLGESADFADHFIVGGF